MSRRRTTLTRPAPAPQRSRQQAKAPPRAASAPLPEASGEGTAASQAPSRSAFARVCDGIVEACWLAALIVAPLFFNSYSDREVLPDKVAIVRTLALLGLAVWLARVAIERQRPRWPAALRPAAPVAVPAAALAAAYLLSSLFSVLPRLSWLGSYDRGEGAYTMASYLVLFALAAATLRGREQIDRLIDVSLAASFPVGVYSVIQRLHVDPVPWGQDTSVRVLSTLGNPIFVGAYLVMVIPFAALRLWQALQAARSGRPSAPAWGFGGLLALQLVALSFSGSRGPSLGLAAGAALAAAIVLAVKRPDVFQRGFLLGVGLAALVAAGGITGARTPAGTAGPLRALAGLLSPKDASSQERQLLWQGTVRLASPHQPILFPDGSGDAFNALRPLIGYGPETMSGVFNQFYPPEVAHFERDKSWDRPHNETLHALAATGLLGAAAYLSLFAGLLFLALRRIGLVPSGQGRRCAVWCLAGAAVGGAVLTAWKGASYVGIGLPFGLLAGVGGYLAWLAVGRRDLLRGATLDPLALALLAAVTAHFVETQFGIAMVASWVQLWLLAAVLAAPQGGAISSFGAPQSSNLSLRRARGLSGPAAAAPWLAAPLLTCLGITLTYDFIRKDGGGLPQALLIVISGLVVAALLLTPEPGRRLAVLLAGAGGVVVFLVYQLATLSQQASGDTPADIAAALAGRSGAFAGYAFALLALAVCCGVLLARLEPGRAIPGAGLGGLAAAVVVAGVAGFAANVRPVQADILYKAAQSQLQGSGSVDTALAAFDRVLAIAPGEDQYRLGLAQVYAAASNQAQSAGEQRQLFAQAEQQLQAARERNPLEPTHSANLARLYHGMADLVPEPEKPGFEAQTQAAYQAALRVAPFNVGFWNEWARFDLSRDDLAAAKSKLDAAVALDTEFDGAWVTQGDYWSAVARDDNDGQRSAHEWASAAEAYSRALALEAGKPVDPTFALQANLGWGSASTALDKPSDAQRAYLAALRLAPPDQQWTIYRDLAQAYLADGNHPAAADAARRGRAVAPPAQQPSFDDLIGQAQ